MKTYADRPELFVFRVLCGKQNLYLRALCVFVVQFSVFLRALCVLCGEDFFFF
jgi:hypothetical protein